MKEQVLMGAKKFDRKSVDNKGRLNLGSRFADHEFFVSEKEDGTIVLEPAITVPAREVWLWKNKKAMATVQKGLMEAEEGQFAEDPMDEKDSSWISKIEDSEE